MQDYLVVTEENHIGPLTYHAFCHKAAYGLDPAQIEYLERVNLDVVAERPLPKETAERMEGLLGALQEFLHENKHLPVTHRVDHFLKKNNIVTTI